MSERWFDRVKTTTFEVSNVETMREAFVKAFDKWEREYREHPENYLTAEQIAELPTLTLAEQRARVFIALLSEPQPA